MKNLMKNTTKRTNLMTDLVVIVAYVIMQTLYSLGMLSNSLRGQLVPICTYIVLAASLNLVVGISGELSLGHAGFMGVGAFTGIVAATVAQSAVGSPILRLIIAMIAGGIDPDDIVDQMPFAGVLLKKDKDLQTLQKNLR